MKLCLNAIQDCRTEEDFVIQGYKSKLQVLDVGINKPFKDYVKQYYKEFGVKNDGKKVSQLDVAKWVSTAWGKIHVESICNTWSSIGINATTTI